MRAQIYNGRLRIDLLRDKRKVMRAVQLALAADLPMIEINPWGEDGTYQVLIGATDDTFAAHGFAAILSVVAELSGETPEQVLDTFRAMSQFDVAKEKLGQLAASSTPE